MTHVAFPYVVTNFDGRVISRHRSCDAALRIEQRERAAARRMSSGGTTVYPQRMAWEVDRPVEIGDRVRSVTYEGGWATPLEWSR